MRACRVVENGINEIDKEKRQAENKLKPEPVLPLVGREIQHILRDVQPHQHAAVHIIIVVRCLQKQHRTRNRTEYVQDIGQHQNIFRVRCVSRYIQ